MSADAQDPEYLSPLLSDERQLKREAVRRRKQFEEKNVAQSEVLEHETVGWVFDRELKKRTRVKREKALDERLENRFWSVLFRMGYHEMNAGRSFRRGCRLMN